MADPAKDQVEAALARVIDPHIDSDLVAAKAVKDITIDGGSVKIDVVLGYPALGWCDKLAVLLRDEVNKVDGVTDVEIDIQTKISAHAVQKGVDPLKGVKNVIAIASGKGGVGKSTVAVNLALALAAEGATVGIMDADIYGPSQPRMLGLSGRPDSADGKSLDPMVAYKIQSMSIGYLVDQDQPMIWRGPMVTQALDQLIHETNWTDIDYLIIDLPPGTGDVQLTLAQKIPVSGAVIVTTPQEIALMDARKGLKMFEKVEVPVLGIVENMSTHICSNCGHEEHIFGTGGGIKMAEQADVTFLGSLPLDMRIREETDNGRPTVVAEPESVIAQSYRAIARRVAGKLSQQAKNFAARFPSIVIDNG
ncbi:MAG: iron-sulfur cluster carrier protein ApbC [Gammaproteobacteria bacterium]|nr:MAG: iron-sulfur cluster carrier protein ApbC [Gammaproteobacteria bacterium]